MQSVDEVYDETRIPFLDTKTECNFIALIFGMARDASSSDFCVKVVVLGGIPFINFGLAEEWAAGKNHQKNNLSPLIYHFKFYILYSLNHTSFFPQDTIPPWEKKSNRQHMLSGQKSNKT